MNREEIEAYIDDYIDMGLFRDPSIAKPYLMDGFQLGYKYRESEERKAFKEEDTNE